MVRTLKLLGLLMAAAPLSTLLACSTSSGGGQGASCDVGGADGGECTPGTTPDFTACPIPMSPTISFAKDIQPIFNQSCAISGSTCHGSPGINEMTTGQVYLGLSADAGVPDASQILSGIVGKTSPENTTMEIIKAGDPANSYMMHKLDYDQCQFAKTCNATTNQIFVNCGLGMPYNSGTLDIPTREKIRAWIAQGAQNN
jgi:hypothetical protein